MCTNKPNYIKKYYKKMRNRIINQLGGKCVSCFDTKNLHVHHKKPLLTQSGRGKLYRLTDWKKQLTTGNIIIVCKNCHMEI